ncbi:MAG TPA: hypothetical protein ENN08_04660 [Bacteroidales bacterium]|nr:hypothetical protein [Bacteroidales bacterium]
MKTKINLIFPMVVMALFLFIGHTSAQPAIITQWTFDDTIEPSTGEGTASLIGGVTQHSATMSNGWRITDFPEQYVGSGTAGAQFIVSTEGYQNIVLDFGHRSSGTMSRWAEIHYTTDGGANWQVLANNNGDLTPHDVVYPFSFDFSSVAAASDNPLFGVRIVSIFSPVAFNPEAPDSTFAANTAYHRARTPGTGGNPYSGDGNWRLLEVTFAGEAIMPGGAEKLTIVDFNGGNIPELNVPFYLTVQTQNINNEPTAIEIDTEVSISVTSGTGSLNGTLAQVIPAGEHTLSFSDLTYDVAENGVVLTVAATSGMVLEPAISEPFEVVYPLENIIAKWTFDDTTEPVIGEGVASLIGGVTQHSASIGSGWRITNFPEQYDGSGTAGAQFMVSTDGYQNIVLDFGHRSSGTMSRWAEIHYTTDGGANWQVLDNNNGNLTPHDVVYPFNFDFSSVSGTANNAGFGVRIVSVFSPVAFNPEVPDSTFAANTAYHRARTPGTGGNPYSGGGNWRLLEVTFLGEPLGILPGDANCDGIVNILDAVTIVNYIMTGNVHPFCFDNADVNSDGLIDVLDVVGTVNIILGRVRK